MELHTDTRLSSLEQFLEHTLEGLGYELVDFNLSNHNRQLRVFIDKIHEHEGALSTGITLSDCEGVTRQLQRVLAVEGIEYDRLEVSSPGLDRKLRKPSDFIRFAGHEADVRLREPVNGRRHFVGIVRRVVGDQLEIEVGGASLMLALQNLDKARLVPKIESRRSR